MSIQIEYRNTQIAADHLAEDLEAFFDGLPDADEATLADAKAADVDLEHLKSSRQGVRVEGRGSALTGVEEAILIYLAEKGLEAAWEFVIRPWIERRRGAKALGEASDPAA